MPRSISFNFTAFSSMADSLSDNSSLVVKNGGFAAQGKVGTFFTLKSTNRQAGDALFSVVRQKYGNTVADGAGSPPAQRARRGASAQRETSCAMCSTAPPTWPTAFPASMPTWPVTSCSATPARATPATSRTPSTISARRKAWIRGASAAHGRVRRGGQSGGLGRKNGRGDELRGFERHGAHGLHARFEESLERSAGRSLSCLSRNARRGFRARRFPESRCGAASAARPRGEHDRASRGGTCRRRQPRVRRSGDVARHCRRLP